MTETSLLESSLAELGARLAARAVSSVELTRCFLGRIEALNASLNAVVTLDAERSLDAARAADARIATGDAQPLTGIPVLHKDIFCVRDWRTTCASRMLENFVAPYDANVI